MVNRNTTLDEDARNRANTNTTRAQKKRIVLISFLIAMVLLAVLWIWKTIQINNVKAEAETKQQETRNNALQAIITTNLENLKLWAKPYAWAIRTALMRGDLSQVNQYGEEMIKEKNMQSIVVANQEGIVISSTNKKFEGQDFTIAGKPAYLTSDSTIVEKINDHLIVVSSPIMGYNNRLGTLLISYRLSIPPFLQNIQ
jgi:sensor histidine kinase regulating citrate/malate metabolism